MMPVFLEQSLALPMPAKDLYIYICDQVRVYAGQLNYFHQLGPLCWFCQGESNYIYMLIN